MNYFQRKDTLFGKFYQKRFCKNYGYKDSLFGNKAIYSLSY